MELKTKKQVTGQDIARLVEGHDGPFVALNGDQLYVGSAEPGHSITSLRPVGNLRTQDPEEWAVIRFGITDMESYQGQAQNQNRERQRQNV